jgi:Pectate lyase superfamily protein
MVTNHSYLDRILSIILIITLPTPLGCSLPDNQSALSKFTDQPAWSKLASQPAWSKIKTQEVIFPSDAGVIDVTKTPYNAQGDGKTDDTIAIQRAINDYTGQRNIIYLPNGTYLISNTLRWPDKDRNGKQVWGFTHIQGQSLTKTILRLQDGIFKNSQTPQPLMTSGQHGSADWFGNYVSDLSIDIGQNNPGVIGLQFFSNNAGAVRNVAITSQDLQGVIGLDLGYNDMNGPLLVKNVSVRGFATGIHTGRSVNSQTFEHIELHQQKQVGLQNDGQVISARDLQSVNTSPAILNNSGFLVLTDSTFQSSAGLSSSSAIVNHGNLYARNLQANGYSNAIKTDSAATKTVQGPTVNEFTSEAPISLFPSPSRAIGLSIRETPEMPSENPRSWANVVKFGADPTAQKDSAAGIQAAIDSGATTIYFPTGSYNIGTPILIRKKVRRVIGFNSWVDYFQKVTPTFRVVDGDAPVVQIENFNPIGSGITHETTRTLILKDSAVRDYRSTSQGDLFIENVAAGPWLFDRQRVWARQINPENKGTHIVNNGGQIWTLGLKTERGGTLVQTLAGGKTQIDGGFSYTTEFGKLAPMFVNQNSDFSAAFAEVCNNNDPYTTIISEKRGQETRILSNKDSQWKGRFVLYTGHTNN